MKNLFNIVSKDYIKLELEEERQRSIELEAQFWQEAIEFKSILKKAKELLK